MNTGANSEERQRPNLKELLLAPEPHTENLTRPRVMHRRRKPPDFDQHPSSTCSREGGESSPP